MKESGCVPMRFWQLAVCYVRRRSGIQEAVAGIPIIKCEFKGIGNDHCKKHRAVEWATITLRTHDGEGSQGGGHVAGCRVSTSSAKLHTWMMRLVSVVPHVDPRPSPGHLGTKKFHGRIITLRAHHTNPIIDNWGPPRNATWSCSTSSYGGICSTTVHLFLR